MKVKIFKNGEIIELENYKPLKTRHKPQNQDEEATDNIE